MSLPFQIFAHKGLGQGFCKLSNHSQLNLRSLNANQVQLGVNASNGNVFIQDTSFPIKADGIRLKLGMMFNTQEQKWRFGDQAKINFGHKNAFFSFTKQLEIIEADGTHRLYTANKDKVFISNEYGDEGKSYIQSSKEGYERVWFNTGVKEYFDRNGHLKTRSFSNGTRLQFEYHHDEVCSIQFLPSGKVVKLRDKDGHNLNFDLIVQAADLNESVIATYGFTNASRTGDLKTSIFRPNGTHHFNEYRISGERLNITSDESRLTAIDFQKQKISRLTFGEKDPLEWMFSYDNQTLEIKDALSDSYQIRLDDKGHLQSLKMPQTLQPERFEFDPACQLLNHVYPNESREIFNYDSELGLVSAFTDAMGNEHVFIYAQSPALKGLKIAEIISDRECGKDAAEFYVYNPQRELQYHISKAGRVTKFVYEHGKVIRELHLKTKRYLLQAQDFKNPSTYDLMRLETFWNSLTEDDKTTLQVMDYRYDDYGCRKDVIQYTKLDKNSSGIETLDCAHTIKERNACGLAIQTSIKKDATHQLRNAAIKDPLGRVVSLKEGLKKNNQALRETHYGFEGKKHIKTNENGTALIEHINQQGLISTIEEVTKQGTRKTNIKHDLRGFLKECETNSKVSQFSYDAKSRKLYELFPDGRLACFVYQENRNQVIKKVYAKLPWPLKEGLDIQAQLASLKPLSTTHLISDALGQLKFSVELKEKLNEDGTLSQIAHVKAHEYAFSDRTLTKEYLKSYSALDDITEESLAAFCQGEDQKYEENVRATRYFYDADHLLIGEQTLTKQRDSKSYGFLKTYDRDGCGQIYHETTYLSESQFASELEATIPEYKKALHSWFVRDNAGRCKAKIDSDGFVRLYDYYANGSIKNEFHLLDPIEVPSLLTFEMLQKLPLPVPTKRDSHLEYLYDDLNRRTSVINHTTNKRVDTAYDREDAITSEIEIDLITGAKREQRKEYNDFHEIIKTRDARQISLSSDTKTFSSKFNVDKKTGLKKAFIDALSQTTYFYYDASRRPVVRIKPDGSVTQFKYEGLDDTATTMIQFDERLKMEGFTYQGNGFIDASSLNKLLPSRQPSKDLLKTILVNGCGEVLKSQSTHGGRLSAHYNAFSDIETEYEEVEPNRFLEKKYRYDLRGNKIEAQSDPNGMNVQSFWTYDDALNRLSKSVAPNGRTLLHDYPSMREEIIREGGYQKRIKKDALMRVISETNWRGQETKHEYNDLERTHTIFPPNGGKVIEKRNAFDEVIEINNNGAITLFERGADGEIEKITYPDGSQETRKIDACSQLVETIDVLGKTTSIDVDLEHSTKQISESAAGVQCMSEQHFDAFGEIELQVSPAKVKTQFIRNRTDQRLEQIIDPDHLNISSQRQVNFQGNVLHEFQGDETLAYQADHSYDLLGRELGKSVIGPDGNPIKVSTKDYNAASTVTITTDGEGHRHFKCVDHRGNGRFQIDACGFVTEKRYDADDHEIFSRSYATPLAKAALDRLTTTTTLDEIGKQLVTSKEDALVYKLFEGEDCRYQLQQIEPGLFKVTGFEYNKRHAVTKQTDYYQTLKTPLNELTDEVILQQLNQASFKDHPQNRVQAFARDLCDNPVFSRDGEGYITERIFDGAKDALMTIRYADNGASINFTQTPGAIRNSLNENNTENRYSFALKDAFGNLAYEIDAEGYVKAHLYNNDHKKIDEFAYFKNLSRAQINILFKEIRSTKESTDAIKTLKHYINDLKNPEKDQHIHYKIDEAGRHTGEIDGEGHESTITYNALNLPEVYKDKCGNEWRTEYNEKKQAVKTISPAVEISTVSKEEDGLLHPHTEIKTVETKTNFDQAGQKESITFAANIEGQARHIKTVHNARGEAVGTIIDNVTVDNGDEALPDLAVRPEKIVTVTTKTVFDFAGAPLVSVDENGNASFVVYDALHRKRFTIDGEGYVVEYRYQSTFADPEETIEYQEKIPQACLSKHLEQGFTLDDAASAIQNFSYDAARHTYLSYDRRGLKTEAKKDEVLIADKEGEEVKLVSFAPKTICKWSAFAELLEQAEDISPKSSSVTRIVRDRLGHEKRIISPKGFVTEIQHGMTPIGKNSADAILLRKVERAKAHKRKDRNSPILMDGKDRVFDYFYDRNLREIEARITSEDEMRVAGTDQLTKTLVQQTEYDAEGRAIAFIINGAKRFLMRDARGDVKFETEVPRVIDLDDLDADGKLKEHIPLTEHFISAHQEKVASVQFANGCHIQEVEGKTALQKPPRSEQDQETVILTDSRGCPLITQTPEQLLKHQTFDAGRKPIKKYQTRTGYTYQQGAPSVIKHLDYQSSQYDKRNIEVASLRGDETGIVKTCKTINAYQECVGEGPAPDQMLVNRDFNKCGHLTYSDEDKGIPTLYACNAQGAPVVTVRAPELDLSTYRDPKAQASLLNQSYEDTFGKIQRSVEWRDEEGNVVETESPWFQSQADDEPQHIVMSFSVESVNGKTFIQWDALDEKLVTPEFKYRRKGETKWITLQANQNGTQVDVSHLASDQYEYQLDFFLKENKTTERAYSPTYRASGVVALDTGDYSQSKGISSYMEDEKTLILCGQLENITGVELVADGKPFKRVSGTTILPGKMRINLNEIESGDYQIRALKGYKAAGTPATIFTATPGYCDELVNAGNPPDVSRAFANTYPPGSFINSLTHYATAPLPKHPRDNNYKRECYDYNVGRGDSCNVQVDTAHQLIGTYVYAVDTTTGQQFYMDRGVHWSPFIPKGWTNYFDGDRHHLNPIIGKPYSVALYPTIAADGLVRKTPQGEIVVQTHPWANHAYRLEYPGPEPDSHLFSLNEAETTEVLSTIAVRSKKSSAVMTAKSLCLSNLEIRTYQIGGYRRNEPEAFKGSENTYYHYQWNTNTREDTSLVVSHHGVGKEVHSLKGLPPAGNTDTPSNFQTMVTGPNGQQAMALNVDLCDREDGASIPIGRNLQPHYYEKNEHDKPIIQINKKVSYKAIYKGITTYDPLHCLYFRPIPPEFKNLDIAFEYEETLPGNKKVWRQDKEVTCFHTTRLNGTGGHGLSVTTTKLTSGIYRYRFRNQATGELLNLESVGVTLTNDAHGQVTINRSGSTKRLFQSDYVPNKMVTLKPKAYADYDRWHNVLSRAKDDDPKTYSSYDVQNQEIETVTPTVTVVDEHNQKSKKPLKTKRLFDTNKHQVQETHANSHAANYVVNRAGDYLKITDADQVSNTYAVDLFHQKTKVIDHKKRTTTVKHFRKHGLKIEQITLPNQKPHEFEINERNNCIRDKRSIANDKTPERYHDFDGNDNETLSIETKDVKKRLYGVRKQRFDLHSGIKTRLEDEDGNVKTWSAGAPGTVDHYHGNVLSHTDFSGQRINYQLNRNKKLMAEVGVEKTSHKSRGRKDVNKNEEPPLKNIRYIRDAADHDIALIDDGAGLTTHKRYNAKDLCIGYKFLNRDGHVYQATSVKHDLLSRIKKLFDTRIAIKRAYDENSNIRYANTFIIEDKDKWMLKDSFFTYTPANRPKVRDGKLIDERDIRVAPGQGLELDYDGAEVKNQRFITPEGIVEEKALGYNHPVGLLTDVVTSRDKDVLELENRDYEGLRLKETKLTRRHILVGAANHEPKEHEWQQYKHPTYVLIHAAKHGPFQLFYYCNGERHEVSLNHHGVKDLYKEILDGCQDKLGDDINHDARLLHDIKSKVQGYHEEYHGKTETTRNDYNDADELIAQHHEEKDLKTDKTMLLHPSGRSLSEVNVVDLTIHHEDNEKKPDETSRIKYEDTIIPEYSYGEDVKVQSAMASRKVLERTNRAKVTDPPSPAVMQTAQNANSSITNVEGDCPERSASFVVNSEELIVEKQTTHGRNYYFYAQKVPGKTVLMAYFGDIPEALRLAVKNGLVPPPEYHPNVINTDVSHHPISASYPPPAPSTYTTPRKMNFVQIAEELNFTGYEAAIAHWNGHDPLDEMPANSTIKVPSLYMEIPDTAFNGDCPSVDSIIASIYPTLPSPNIKIKPPKVDYAEMIIEAAAVAAVMCVMPAALGGAIGYLGVGAAEGAATFASVAQTAAIYAASGALANAAGQGVGLAMGAQTKFSGKSMALNAMASGITGGVMRANNIPLSANGLPDYSKTTLVHAVLTAEAAALIKESVMLALQVHKRPDFKGFAVAGANAVVNYTAGGIQNPVLNAGINAGASNTISSLIYTGRLSKDIPAQTLGAMIGTGIGTSIAEHMQPAQTPAPEMTTTYQRPQVSASSSHAVPSNPRPVNDDSLLAVEIMQTEEALELANALPTTTLTADTSPLLYHTDEATQGLSMMAQAKMRRPIYIGDHTPISAEDYHRLEASLTPPASKWAAGAQLGLGVLGLAGCAAIEASVVGAAVGVPLCLFAANTTENAARTLWTGHEEKSVLTQLGAKAGLSENAVEKLELGIGLTAGGVGLAKVVAPKITPMAKTALSKFSLFSKGGGKSAISEATDRLQLEKLKTTYRQNSSWVNPSEIKNPKLHDIVNNLYREKATYGSGSTADAARIEIAKPGFKVGGGDHITKAQNSVRRLEKLINNENLNAHERMIAENVRLDLLDALGDKLWYSQTNIPKF